MRAYIQAIEKGSLQQEDVRGKVDFWYAQIPDLNISKDRIRFSFRWKEYQYQIQTKSTDGYYYSGIVSCPGFDDEKIDFNYYLNKNHHLIIGNWQEHDRYYQIIVEGHN